MIAHNNNHWPDIKPRLSILVPFLRDDPSPLLNALEAEQGDHDHRIEIILLDDGTRNETLTRQLTLQTNASRYGVRLLTAEDNLGRAEGRNRLATEARGDNLLFIDADMLPDRSDFIRSWLRYVNSHNPQACFGGFSVDQAPSDPRYAVHKHMARKSDCLPAHVRALKPEKHVFTSNLLIRKDVFAHHPFDAHFTGWGWEDVEWSMRVAKSHTISHIENTATHMGLDTVPALMEKYRQSAANFARIVSLHPEFVAEYPSYLYARRFNRWGITAAVRAVSAWVATQEMLPTPIRALALRFFRSALYAEALKPSLDAAR